MQLTLTLPVPPPLHSPSLSFIRACGGGRSVRRPSLAPSLGHRRRSASNLPVLPLASRPAVAVAALQTALATLKFKGIAETGVLYRARRMVEEKLLLTSNCCSCGAPTETANQSEEHLTNVSTKDSP